VVKIFQGDCHTVENDMNNWIEVYSPKIQDMKQSVIYIEKEHSVMLILTVLYEAKGETEKVQYRIYKQKQ
jgi:hypothetical protein